MSVYLQCVECDQNSIEFSSIAYRPHADLEFECANCGFTDTLLANQSVAEYAKEFERTVKAKASK